MHKYTKVKLLGQGGFGSATLVSSKADAKRLYVVKEVRLSGDKKATEDAKREASFLASMKHPNIVGYVESFTEGPGTGNKLVIVMEYADGGDLHGRISALKKSTPLPGGGMGEDEALGYFVQVCLALKHMHDRCVLHRDLKSQNVFLTRKGVVKVGDLGIAKALSSSMDMAKTQIGTPYYLSPEICCDRPYNKKSDMWALGVMLYEMLALHLPFTAPDLPRLVTKILAGSYPPLPQRFSPPLAALVDALLQKDPKARPSVGQVLRSELVQARIARFLTQTLAAREFGEALRIPGLPHPPPTDPPAQQQHQPALAAAPAAAVKLQAAVVAPRPLGVAGAPAARLPSPLPPAAGGGAGVGGAAPARIPSPVPHSQAGPAAHVAVSADAARRQGVDALSAAEARRKADIASAQAAAEVREQARRAAEALAAGEARKRRLLDLVAKERQAQREREAADAALLAEAQRQARDARARAKVRSDAAARDRREREKAAVDDLSAEERRQRREGAAASRAAWIAARKADMERGWVDLAPQDEGSGHMEEEEEEGGGGGGAADVAQILPLVAQQPPQAQVQRAPLLQPSVDNQDAPSVRHEARAEGVVGAAQAAALAYRARQEAVGAGERAGQGRVAYPHPVQATPLPFEPLTPQDAQALYLARLEAGRKQAWVDRQAVAARAARERAREAEGGWEGDRGRGESRGRDHGPSEVRAAAKARREALVAAQEEQLREAARAALHERRSLEARGRDVERQARAEAGVGAGVGQARAEAGVGAGVGRAGSSRGSSPGSRAQAGSEEEEQGDKTSARERAAAAAKAAAAAADGARLEALSAAAREAWLVRKALQERAKGSGAEEGAPMQAGCTVSTQGGDEEAPLTALDPSVIIYSPGSRKAGGAPRAGEPARAGEAGARAWNPPPLQSSKSEGGRGAGGLSSLSPPAGQPVSESDTATATLPAAAALRAGPGALHPPRLGVAVEFGPSPVLATGEDGRALGPLQLALMTRRRAGAGAGAGAGAPPAQAKPGAVGEEKGAARAASGKHSVKAAAPASKAGGKSSAGVVQTGGRGSPSAGVNAIRGIPKAGVPTGSNPSSAPASTRPPVINADRARAALSAIDRAVANVIQLRHVQAGRASAGARPSPSATAGPPHAATAAATTTIEEDEAEAVALEVEVAAITEQLVSVLGKGPRPLTAGRRPSRRLTVLSLPRVEEGEEEEGEGDEEGDGSVPAGGEEEGGSEDSEESDDDEEEDEEEEAGNGGQGGGDPSPSRRSYTGMPNMQTILAALALADAEGYGPGGAASGGQSGDGREGADRAWAAPHNADSDEEGGGDSSPSSALLLSTTLRPAQLRTSGLPAPVVFGGVGRGVQPRPPPGAQNAQAGGEGAGEGEGEASDEGEDARDYRPLVLGT